MNLTEIGKRIKNLREESKLTQLEIAKYLDVEESTIDSIENGKENINSDVIEKLASLFFCKIDYILFGINKPQHISIKENFTTEELKHLATTNKIALNQFEMDKLLQTSTSKKKGV